MAKDNLTKHANISTSVREIDFVTRFATNWEALREILGVTRPIRKAPGSKLVALTGSVELQSGNVGEGEEIPYSLATVTQKEYGDITLEKYAKAVSIEAVSKYGAQVAIAKTDDAFLAQLQNNVTNRFYDFLKTGLLTNVQTTFQSGLAMAQGYVRNMWKAMNKDITEVVGFVNILDFYTYLGGAQISVQRSFGMDYIKDFLGYRVIFLMDDTRVPRNTIIATPVENIIPYYVDPSDADFASLGLVYTVAGETPFIGFHAQGNYGTAVGENYALMGFTLFAEYLNGIAVITVEASGSLGSLTVASAAATNTTGGTKLTMSVPTYDNIPADWSFYYKGDASAAPSVSYLDVPDLSTWTAVNWTKVSTNAVCDDFKPTGMASGDKATVIAVNGSGQVVSKATIASITVKA